jgi:hypothetical protein
MKQEESTGAAVWEGTTSVDSLNEEAARARHDFADAAKAGAWPRVFEILRAHPNFVNVCRPGSVSLYAPLHQAAYAGASEEVVRTLLECGAWRCLRNAHGGRPVDVATVRGHAHLIQLLKPVYTRRIPLEDLMSIQRHFHRVIDGRVRRLVQQHRLRLPELEPLLELGRRKTWFAIPGMYGGFSYWLDGTGPTASLFAESWCRIEEGSGQRHKITPRGSELIEEGFV